MVDMKEAEALQEQTRAKFKTWREKHPGVKFEDAFKESGLSRHHYYYLQSIAKNRSRVRRVAVKSIKRRVKKKEITYQEIPVKTNDDKVGFLYGSPEAVGRAAKEMMN